MVEESIKAYLNTKLDTEIDLNTLTEYNTDSKYQLIKALSEIKILDPACGSGAFPMGILHKIVQILKTIDPDNTVWKKVQKEKLLIELDKAYDKNQKEERETEIKRLNHVFENNLEDYGRKLYIIRNCIYGVDIQDVAIQISKLRFFLALIIDQPNEHIEPLPNLETKFVIANTLIGIDLPDDDVFGEHDPTKEIKEELKKLREKHFTASDRNEKNKLKAEDTRLREQLVKTIENELLKRNKQKITELKAMLIPLKAELLKAQNLPKEIEIIETTDLFGVVSKHSIDKTKTKIKDIADRIFKVETQISKEENTTASNKIIDTAKKLAHWDIYDQNTQATWFDMNWMFGIKEGFDIVIGNPPYVDSEVMTRLYPGLREVLSKSYETTKGNWDIYIPFYEIGFRFLNKFGTLCYITPNKWLSIGYGKSLRGFAKTNVSKICNCSQIKVFEAGNNPVIIFLSRNKCENNLLLDEFEYENIAVSIGNACREYLENDDWGFFLSKNLKTLLRIREEFENFGSFIKAENPFTTGEAYELIPLLADGKHTNKTFKFVNTGTIEPYMSLWGLSKTTYLKSKYLQPVIERKEFKHAFPKRYTQMNNQKLIISGIRYFEVFFDEKGEYIVGKSAIFIRVFKPKIKPKAVMAIFNSKFISWYINETYGVLGIDGGVNFSVDMIEALPFPNKFISSQDSLIAIVNKILSFKEDNSNADTTKFENQIDELVYKLYGLTEEEIKIVEGRS